MVLVDTNVIIDFLIIREPYYKTSSEIIMKCASGETDGCIAFHSIPDLWYILRKIPEDKRRKWLSDICEFLQVKGANHEDVLRAKRFGSFTRGILGNHIQYHVRQY